MRLNPSSDAPAETSDELGRPAVLDGKSSCIHTGDPMPALKHDLAISGQLVQAGRNLLNEHIDRTGNMASLIFPPNRQLDAQWHENGIVEMADNRIKSGMRSMGLNAYAATINGALLHTTALEDHTRPTRWRTYLGACAGTTAGPCRPTARWT
jgi:hypothetical protein